MGGAQYAASAAALSPMSPVAASSASSTGGPAPQPPSSTTGLDPASASAAGSSGQHKRVYQACIPCRRRKVRCDLGSVDDPHDPPCVRCRRECKECYFSATRRKRKNEDDPAEELDERDADDYILRNGRKQLRTEGVVPATNFDRSLFSEVPLAPGANQIRTHPLKRPGDSKSSVDARSSAGGEFGAGEPNTPLENLEARTVMRREVYGPHDALDLLYKAATDKSVHLRPLEASVPRFIDVAGVNSSSHKHDDHTATSGGASQPSAQRTRPDTASHHHSSHSRDHEGYLPRQASRRDGTTDQAIDPELIKRDTSTDPGYSEALKAWARFRFVRAGWFTAQEAIDYIE